MNFFDDNVIKKDRFCDVEINNYQDEEALLFTYSSLF